MRRHQPGAATCACWDRRSARLRPGAERPPRGGLARIAVHAVDAAAGHVPDPRDRGGVAVAGPPALGHHTHTEHEFGPDLLQRANPHRGLEAERLPALDPCAGGVEAVDGLADEPEPIHGAKLERVVTEAAKRRSVAASERLVRAPDEL